MTGRKRLAILALVAAIGGIATLANALLPSTTVDPQNVPLGTLAGQTSVDVLSIDAFVRAISSEYGTNTVVQHIRLGPGQSTGWHTHPGPNMVVVVEGSGTLIDQHCHATTYGPGQAFSTGLQVHNVVAGPEGDDVYSIYLLPGNATVLRTDANPPKCDE